MADILDPLSLLHDVLNDVGMDIQRLESELGLDEPASTPPAMVRQFSQEIRPTLARTSLYTPHSNTRTSRFSSADSQHPSTGTLISRRVYDRPSYMAAISPTAIPRSDRDKTYIEAKRRANDFRRTQLESFTPQPKKLSKLASPQTPVPQIARRRASVASVHSIRESPLTSARDDVRAAEARQYEAELQSRQKAIAALGVGSVRDYKRYVGLTLEERAQCDTGLTRFQALWRAHVVRNSLKQPLKLHRKRQRVVLELLDTEERFHTALCTMVDRYYKPLVTADLLPAAVVEAIIPTDAINQILAISAKIRAALSQRLFHGYGLYTRVGDTLLPLLDGLMVYSPYINGFDRMMKALTDAKAQCPELDAWLGDVASGGLDLSSYLIMPVQRIPRLELLIRDIKKDVPEGHPDHADLDAVFEGLKRIGQFINENKRTEESRQAVETFERGVRGLPDGVLLSAPGRRMIKQGAGLKRSKLQQARTTAVTAALMTGVLVLADEKKDRLEFTRAIPLHDATITDLRPFGLGECIGVSDPSGTGCVLAFDTAAEREAWVQALHLAISDAALADPELSAIDEVLSGGFDTPMTESPALTPKLSMGRLAPDQTVYLTTQETFGAEMDSPLSQLLPLSE
ncbi:RhoGEF domain [Carpediemonas membranifera]|uniref:RhoGEF domain n=1 Tax=Carpediemonas membranifera TaxID=201153 RepID=A0A8J6B791_9EUKA|nr:RhoGEF domain [Carpediemonas membranifera]|eukprot:KAG9397113.1 RhoGEF domain [Carpediemonas membranifera]